MSRYLIAVDTPGIKQFVFGTDPLAEVRGASALLDRLNRSEMEQTLRQALRASGGAVDVVYANGGAGQFVIEAEGAKTVSAALAMLVRKSREATGGEVGMVTAMVPFTSDVDYPGAARLAHEQLRTRREMGQGPRAATLLPLMRECDSSSHLPARQPYPIGEQTLLLSEASIRKRRESQVHGHDDHWASWMAYLENQGGWVGPAWWEALRPDTTNAVGEVSRSRPGYIGLVYADGNAMGRVVQELDSVATCQAFSTLVDGSIRHACHRALTDACAAEIAENRKPREDQAGVVLPADILLLGGDDLVVLLPADRALPFALGVARAFEKLTREEIEKTPDPRVRDFFHKRVGERGLTISCGVALARATYPFYLLLDLAGELLKSAKRAGTAARASDYRAPARVDFHLVAGSSSLELEALRETDYGVKSGAPRTLRPYSLDGLERLREAVDMLRRARFPRSKLNDLFAAALAVQPQEATRRARELFTRCKPGRPDRPWQPDQRRALWDALKLLGMDSEFPWSDRGASTSGRALALADLVEAYDLFPEESAR